MAIAVDTDTVPAAPQPVTSTQDIAESLVSTASDVVAKEGQDAGTSDAQLLADNDNGATSLSKAEEPVCVGFLVRNFAFVTRVIDYLPRMLRTLCLMLRSLRIQILWR